MRDELCNSQEMHLFRRKDCAPHVSTAILHPFKNYVYLVPSYTLAFFWVCRGHVTDYYHQQGHTRRHQAVR